MGSIPEVSLDTYTTDLPPGPKKSFLRTFRDGKRRKLPIFSDLKVGDVILTHGNMKKPHARGIRDIQSKDGRLKPFCDITHAMIYVGKLHVAESVVMSPYIPKTKRVQSGVQIVPLTTAVGSSSIIVRRASVTEEDDKSELRLLAANYALLDHAINRRVYNLTRAGEMGSKGIVKALLGSLSRMSEGADSVICSHFVLECLALGIGVAPDRYIDLIDPGERKEMFPAEFAIMEQLRDVSLSYCNVVPRDAGRGMYV